MSASAAHGVAAHRAQRGEAERSPTEPAKRRLVRIGAVAGLLAGGAACSLTDSPDWHDQLVADSPCYRVNLLDGLDESSTAELRELYSCVDMHGHIAAYGPIVDALEEDSRDGDPAGVELARAVNALGRADLDVFGLAGTALDLMQSQEDPFRRVLDLSIEVTYAERAARVRQDFTLTDPDLLDAGMWAPLRPVVPMVAGALLDDDLDSAEWAGGLVAHDETKRWVRALADLSDSTRADVGPPARALLADAGDALLDARVDGNDRWADATGDSVRDVAVAFTLGVKGGPPILDEISPEAAEILSDPLVRQALPGMLADLHAEGSLPRVPEQLVWLVSVDSDGGALTSGETSALAAMIRLLHATNRPMQCTVDLGITDLEVDLGNMAVSILETLAGQDPSMVQGGVGILGEILDWGLTDAVLHGIADTGVCAGLTGQVVDDLGALDVMAGPEAQDALVLFVAALRVLRDGQESRIPAFVDLASDLHAWGGVPPVEEVVRDVGRSDLVGDVVALVPVLEAPGSYGITAGTEPAPDLADLLDAAQWMFVRDDGTTGWQRMKPLVQAVVDEDGTWEAVGNAAPLMADDGSQIAQLFDLMGPLVEADPDLAILDQVGALLGNRDVAEPLLRAIETPGVADALLAVDPQGDSPEVPLAFGARLVVGGALEDLLSLVDTLLGSI